MTLLIEVVDPQGDKCVATNQAMITGANLYGYVDEDIAPMPVRFDMFNTALAYAIPTLPEADRPNASAVAAELVSINDANRSAANFDPLRIAFRDFLRSNAEAFDSALAAVLDGCEEFDDFPRQIALTIADMPSWNVPG
jgi:hypothetical protein